MVANDYDSCAVVEMGWNRRIVLISSILFWLLFVVFPFENHEGKPVN